MRIVHLSDLHVGAEGMLTRLRHIVGHLKFEFESNPGDHVIVITGDAVDVAGKTNYRQAKAQLDDLEAAGFERILVAPGNHDYGDGLCGNPKWVPVFHEVFYGGPLEFPKLDIIGDIAFIGLDSMMEELNSDDLLGAEGELGTEQRARLEEILRGDAAGCQRRVIYLHHHPFDPYPFHHLKDSEALGEVLNAVIGDGILIDALLYGHNHQGRAHYDHWGIPRCYDAGSATRKPRPQLVELFPWFQVRARSRLIDLENDVPQIDRVLHLL